MLISALHPVQPLQVIKQPMDLSKIRAKMERGVYVILRTTWHGHFIYIFSAVECLLAAVLLPLCRGMTELICAFANV